MSGGDRLDLPAAPDPFPAGQELPYRLTMLSDWHPGTGAGRPGDVDRLVIRDEDGLPYVPAKTVTGLWRDACEIAARALDGPHAERCWQDWVQVAFGSQPGQSDSGRTDGAGRAAERGRPRPAAVSIRRARYSPTVRAAVRGDQLLRNALTFLKPGVKIDEVSGRAEHGMLRFDEQARVGAVLTGVFRLDGELAGGEDARRHLMAVLLAGSRLLEQIGGKRRRGNGRCVLDLPDVTAVDPWWDWLAATEPTAPPPASSAPTQVLGRPGESRPGSGWEVARLTFVLQDPVLAGGRTIGNEIHGLDYLPGATLLPAVLTRLGQPAADALLSGHLIVTNATVCIDGEPGRPVPGTFEQKKGDHHPRKIVNRAACPAEERTRRVRDGYVTATEPLRLVRPALRLRTHNSVDDNAQRPTPEAGGGVYTYRALMPGTTLMAEVRVRAGLLAPDWHAKLSDTWTLGRSRKDDYGRATVTAAAAEPPAPRAVNGRRLTLWLVSDMALINDRLRLCSDPDVLRSALARALGLPDSGLTLVTDSGDGTVPTVLLARRAESWQSRWGLPRATLCGLAAGSVATFDLTGGIIPKPHRIADLETEGLGERRGEGLGQVLVTTAEAGPGILGRFTSGRPQPPASTQAADDTATLSCLRREAWRAEIRIRADLIATDPSMLVKIFGSGVEKLTASQLATLRDVLPGLDDDGRTAQDSLDRIADQSRRRAWPQAVATSTTALFTEHSRVWDLLGWHAGAGLADHVASAADSGVGLDSADEALREELWAEAVQAVVLTALTALRRRQESTDVDEGPHAGGGP